MLNFSPAPPSDAVWPDDLDGLRRGFADVRARSAALLDGLDDRALNWSPAPGRSWSIAQCLDHLTISNTVYLDAMRPAIEQLQRDNRRRQRPIAAPLLGRLFVWSLEPPVRVKMPAPGKIAPPPEPKLKNEVWPAFLDILSERDRLLEACVPFDLNGTVFTNPFFKQWKLTVGTGWLVLGAHDRRHVWQAENIRTAWLRQPA